MTNTFSFFEKIKQIDLILEKKQNPNLELEKVKVLLEDSDVRREFYRQLENNRRSDWLIPLNGIGQFETPPKPIKGKDGALYYPPWPESRYLASVAKKAPEVTLEIFKKIKTENTSVIRDMLKAGASMPGNIAVNLISTIIKSTKFHSGWVFYKEAAEFCINLINSGKSEEALILLISIYRPKISGSPEARKNRENYWYDDGLNKLVPMLSKEIPLKILPELCEWLVNAIKTKENYHTDNKNDLSFLWRPAIEEHEQNRDYDYASTLVRYVRNAFETAIENKAITFGSAIKMLDEQSFLVFKRLQIHLINQFAEENKEAARKTIMELENFSEYQIKHEYAMLVGNRLPLLTSKERKRWFGWIEDGPDLSDFMVTFKRNTGRDATHKDIENRKKYWKYEKLHCVRNHLEGSNKSFYEEMRLTHEIPKLADLNSHVSSGWVKSKSPIELETFASKSFADAVKEISQWKPNKLKSKEETIEGLASTFQQFIAKDPKTCSENAILMKIHRPIFVRTFISQMKDFIKAGQEIRISSVLDLCAWVVSRPDDAPEFQENEKGNSGDNDWKWTREEISRFIETLCKENKDGQPRFSLDLYRLEIGNLLKTLSEEPIKKGDLYQIHDEDPRVKDFVGVGINSSRGKAIEATLEYGRWIASHIKKSADGKEFIPNGFNSLLEVKEILETQLKNPSVEAMSVIGLKLGLIYWIDKDWLKTNANILFNFTGATKNPQNIEGWAAWNSFMVWGNPHKDFYKIFKDQFKFAVQQVSDVGETGETRENPMCRLGEHLLLLYGRGDLGLEEDGGIIKEFLNSANPEIRCHAIGFVGEALGNSDKDEIPSKVLENYRELWEFYWPKYGEKDAKDKPGALLFGSWFSAGVFPEQWGLEQLTKFIKLNPKPEPDHIILKRLKETATNNPLTVITILNELIEGDQEGWRIGGWEENAMEILNSAMQSENSKARELAINLINLLGRKGFMDYGKLLGRD